MKICQGGFAPGEWKGKTQFIKVVNPYNYNAYYRVYSAGGGNQLTCIPHGRSMTVDRGTTQVGTIIAAGVLGWGPPAPC